MQVQEISAKGLVREFRITVGWQEIERHVQDRLQEIGQTAKIPGFRPGKIPLPVLKRHYGDAVRGEAIERAFDDTAERTLTERNLRPAMQPKIVPEQGGEGQDLNYTMTVEILPEITPMDFKTLGFERLTADVADSAVDEAILRVVRSVRGPESISEDRGAKTGDVVLIDFDGEAEGKAYPGMKGSNQRLELGSKMMIDTFEDQLVGTKKGETRDVSVTFPEKYHAAELSGKKAVFKVTVKDIMAYAPIELNDDLAKELGVETLTKLRDQVRETMATDYRDIAREVLKRELMDKLADSHDFEVPPGMVESEFVSIWRTIEDDRKKGNLDDEDKTKSEDELKQEYRAIAERRVRLGLLLADVSRKHDLKVEQMELRNALMAEVRQYPGQEEAVFNYFTKTPGALDRLRAPILENKAVDFILSLATVTERKVTPEELMAAPDTVAGNAEGGKASAKRVKKEKSA